MSKKDVLGPYIKDAFENTPEDLKSIAKRFKVNYDTARRWRKEDGWIKKVFKDSLDCLNTPKEIVLRMKDEYENTGATITDLANKYGIDKNTIQPWIQKFNWIKTEEAQKVYKEKLRLRSRQIVQDETYYKAKDLYENTATPVTEISKITGLTINMIWSRVRYDKWVRSKELKHELNSNKFKKMYSEMSEKTKQQQKEKMSQTNKQIWMDRGKEDTNKIIEHKLETMSNKTKEELNEIKQKISKSVSNYYNSNPESITNLSEKGKQRWENKSDKEKDELKQKVKDTWNNKSIEEMNKFINDHKLAWGNKTEEEMVRFKRKISKTLKSKSLEQQKNINNKRHLTRKLNNSYGKSKEEDLLYEYLVQEFGQNNVIRQYTIDNMSFDFKVTRPSLNPKHKGQVIEQLIEFNGSYFHNYRPYISCPEHEKEYNNLIKQGGMKAHIANVWRYNDVEKYNYCLTHDLNYMAIYFEKQNPKPYYTNQELKDSLERIGRSKLNYTNKSSNNEIINNFCYKELYKDNLPKFKQEDCIFKYLVNRIKYAYNYGEGCYQITLLKLLQDFNKSGITTNGFTMYPINNIRKFIYDCGIKSIADPFAGWGHRMIGSYSMNCNYIGCDINKVQYNNLLQIQQFLESNNKNLWKPKITLINDNSLNVDLNCYKYDAIFTCPPYWNTEIYTDKGIENLIYIEFKRQFVQIIKHWITPNVKFIGIQFTEKYEDCIQELGYSYEKIVLGQVIHHFNKNKRKFNECIYIIKL